MKLSARNILKGTIVEVKKGQTTAHVRIDVGGQPTALALNESANTVLVLDASQKKVTEIDGASNKVIGASTFAASGTPTSISVDPSSSKIVVTSNATTTTSPSLTVIDAKRLVPLKTIDLGKGTKCRSQGTELMR